MPKFGPIGRSNLIYFLRKYGFDGPYSGGKHQFMLRKTLRLTIPNPHQSDITIELLNRILKQAGISKKDWDNL